MPRPTVYSRRELLWMQSWQRSKDALLAPVVALLMRFGVSAGVVSAASAVVAAGGLWFGIVTGRWDVFWWFLAGHIVLDGLDGAVARRRGVTSWGGLIDASADAVGIVAASGAMLAITAVSPRLVLTYTALYLLVIGLVLLRSYLGMPYHIVFRPRLLLYVVLFSDALLGTALLPPMLWCAIGVLLIAAIAGVWALAIRLRDQRGQNQPA